MLGEDIKYGQKVIEFTVSALVDEEWIIIAEGTTIGYKRILKLDKITTSQLKLEIIEAKSRPVIAHLELYLE